VTRPGDRRHDLEDRDLGEKEPGPPDRRIDEIVLLLRAAEVAASKRFGWN
jgi:DNA-binding MarR family transcriptional regulator